MTEDAVISVMSAATRIACRRMTLPHLDALQASLEQASGLPARPDWGRKAAAHAELFNVLGGLTGDCDLALLVSSAAGRLHDLVLTVGPGDTTSAHGAGVLFCDGVVVPVRTGL